MLALLINLMLLIGGTSGLSIASLMYIREKSPVLRYYIFAVGCWTLNQIVLIVFYYLNEIQQVRDCRLNALLNDSSYVCMGLFAWWLPRLIYGIFRSDYARFERRFFALAATVIALPIIYLRTAIQGDSTALDIVELCKVLIFYIIIYRMAFKLLFLSRKVADKLVRRFLEAVFWLQMIFYPIMIFEGRGYFDREYPYWISSFALYYFLVNTIAVVFASRYLRLPELRMVKDSDAVEEFCNTYRVSKREAEVISLLIEGKSYRAIADTLFISPETVKTHINNIYRKSGVSNKMELAALIRRYHS